MAKHDVLVFPQGRVSGFLCQQRGAPYTCIEGYVATPHGIVIACTWDKPPAWGEGRRGFYLNFVYEGRGYYTDGATAYTARGLATAAGRFARRVAAEEYGNG